LTISFDRAGQGGGGGGGGGGDSADAKSYLHLDFRLSTVQQYAAVEVRSWDPDKKQKLVAKKTSSTYQFDASVTGQADTGKGYYGSASSGRKYIVVDQPVDSQAEADALAQSLYDQFSMDFLTGEVVVEGNPVLLPGKTIEFSGFGKAFSGKYLITSATHTYRPDEGYRTTVAFSRNAKAS
jgi:phage protein D